jgi:hypothetical protein
MALRCGTTQIEGKYGGKKKGGGEGGRIDGGRWTDGRGKNEATGLIGKTEEETVKGRMTASSRSFVLKINPMRPCFSETELVGCVGDRQSPTPAAPHPRGATKRREKKRGNFFKEDGERMISER